MMGSLGIPIVLGLVACGLFVYARLLIAREARSQSAFAHASNRITLGLPAIADGDLSEDKRRELVEIGQRHAQEYGRIRRVLDDFSLSGSLTIRDGSRARVIRRPWRFLECDVILGESLAGAGLSPGTAVYWLPLPGEQLARQFGIAESEPVAYYASGHLAIEADRHGMRIVDIREGALPRKEISIGTPIILGLDANSEDAIASVFGDGAPARGSLTKVRLFGGFEHRNGQWMIIPMRHEFGDREPRRGYALHPISSLRGVVVASAPHKAFDWEPSMQPSVEPAIQPAPRPVMVAAMPAPLLSA